jgi:hypothetical protein
MLGGDGCCSREKILTLLLASPLPYLPARLRDEGQYPLWAMSLEPFAAQKHAYSYIPPYPWEVYINLPLIESDYAPLNFINPILGLYFSCAVTFPGVLCCMLVDGPVAIFGSTTVIGQLVRHTKSHLE